MSDQSANQGLTLAEKLAKLTSPQNAELAKTLEKAKADTRKEISQSGKVEFPEGAGV